MKQNKRTEEDFIGKVEVPEDAYYGSFTVRAANTFKLSSQKVHRDLTKAVILIKKAAASANKDLKVLDSKLADAIIKSADEALDGKFDSEFILDAYQAGAGTPLHMNVNEVLANRANELLGSEKGLYDLVHPNNHVNKAQSSNDVTHSAIRLAVLKLTKTLLEEMESLEHLWREKAKEHKHFLKTGRTHLQDAVPITYGQVFEAFELALEKDRHQFAESLESMREIGLGGTAVGTGITAHPQFKEKVIYYLSKLTGEKLASPESTVETTHNMNSFLYVSGALRGYSTTLNRIANDLRLLASGPNAGIAELILPEVEPGSSIMPGKVNPSVPEAVNMVCFQIMGNDHTINLASQSGQLELNWMTPLIGQNLLTSIELLTNTIKMFREKCVDGLKVDPKRAHQLLENSFAYATALNPVLGYSLVSKLVTKAHKEHKTLKEVVVPHHLSENEWNKIMKSL